MNLSAAASNGGHGKYVVIIRAEDCAKHPAILVINSPVVIIRRGTAQFRAVCRSVVQPLLRYIGRKKTFTSSAEMGRSELCSIEFVAFIRRASDCCNHTLYKDAEMAVGPDLCRQLGKTDCPIEGL